MGERWSLSALFVLINPLLPCFRHIADGGFFTAADDGGEEHAGVFQRKLLYLGGVGEVCKVKLVIQLALGIQQQVVMPHRLLDILILTRAHTEAGQVDKLVLDASFLEEAFCFLGIEALGFSEDLYIQCHVGSFAIVGFLFFLLGIFFC